MPEAPFTPPPRKPVSTFPTPSPAVAFYTELVNRTDPAYVNNAPVRRGTRYSTIVGAKQDVITQYPDLFFLGERKFQLNDQLVFWDWATDEQASDTYNTEATYVANSVAFPAFTRVYTIRRELYETQPALPIGSALTGLVAVTITNRGQDYTFATGTISGTDCAVEFVVSGSGELLIGVVTNEGSGVTMGETITITGDGSGATAVAVVQSTFCVLTAQKKEELAPDDPLKNEMVRVTRVYETLPGPWIPTTRFDKDGALITSQTRRNVADSVQDSDSIVNDQWIQTTHKGVDDFVAEETTESRSCPGNVVTSSKVEQDGKILTSTRQLVATSAIISSETLSGGVWTKSFGAEVDDSSLIKVHQASNLVSWQVIEARAIPGNGVVSTRLDEDGKPIGITKTLKDTTAIVTSENLSGGFWTHTTKEEVSDLVSREVVEFRAIPGNPILESEVDEDGAPVQITRTLKETITIVTQETVGSGLWNKTHIEKVSDLVSWEVVRLRAIPGNPIIASRVDDDGKPVQTTKTLKDTTTIVTQEVLGGGLWNHTHIEQVSDLVSWEVVELRAIPGNPIIASRVDDDGAPVETIRTLKDTTTIVTQEVLGGGLWNKTSIDKVSDLVSWEVVELRAIPGNAIVSSRLDPDSDPVQITRTLRDTTTITTQEFVAAGIWNKTHIEQVSDLVSWEHIELRVIPGTVVVSTEFDRDGVLKTVSKQLVEASTVITSEVLTPNLLTRKFGESVTDVVSTQIIETITVDSDSLLDYPVFTTSIPNLIPESFRAFIPTQVVSHIIEGAAAQPALAAGEFEHSERQLHPLYKEVRSTTLASVSVPITHTNEETTEQYGGGILNVSITLDSIAMVPDEGLTVVGSTVTDLGNGYFIKETRQLSVAAWPSLIGTHVDERYGISVGITKQIVDAGTVGGLSGSDYIEVRSIDKWRSISIASKLDAGSLPGDTTWFAGQRHSFPPELSDAVLDWAEAACRCSDSFSAILIANMTQYTGTVKTRVTEQFYNGVPPDNVTVTQFFPETHNFGFAWASACGDSDGNCRTKSGAPNFHIPLCLHGNLTLTIGPFITFSFPATNPSVLPHSTYIMLAPHVERWRFGVFRRVLTEVLVPA